jgi:alpha-methylacyl-CoA racemase
LGPLTGLQVVELVGLGPGPFAGMLLADLGASVLCVDRIGGAPGGVLHRGKQVVSLDLKDPRGVEALLRLLENADALIEVFRPGVAERLGFGPSVCLARNPALIYGRLTGWGQEGPWANLAGHDIDYIALAGALDPLGRAGEPPTPPINVLGDFAGGGLLLAFGIMSALWERARSGVGQVVDAAMIDGAAVLMAPFITGRMTGGWGPRGTNMLDTAAPFYEVYETADGKWMAVGAIEPQFNALLLDALDLHDFGDQWDRDRWQQQKARMAQVFASRTQAEWASVFDGTDACVAPVLEPTDATEHPHHVARRTFIPRDDHYEPAPAPRFSRTPAGDPPPIGPGTLWGFTEAEIASLQAAGVLGAQVKGT